MLTPRDTDVVILNYCTPELSLRAARSARQAGVDSILIVDNGSPDGSADKLQRGVQGFAQVLALPENAGFSTGNNRGAAQGNRALLLLLNSDVVLHEGALAALIRVLEQEETVGIVAPALVGSQGEAQASAYRFIKPGRLTNSLLGLDKLSTRFGWEVFGGNVDLPRNGDYTGFAESLYGPCLLLRRQAFEEISGFDEDFFLYCEETDLVLRLAQHGWRAYRTAAGTATHDHNQSAGQAPERSLILMSESHRLYARKHFGWLGRAATAAAFVGGLALRWLLGGGNRARYAAALGVWFHRTPSADPRAHKAASSVGRKPAVEAR